LEIKEDPVGAPRFVQINAAAVQTTATTGVIDLSQFNMTTYNETTLSFGFIHEALQAANPGGQPNAAQIAAFFFAFRSFAIFEYLNNDGIPGFQQSPNNTGDQFISFYDLSHPNLAWKPIILNSTLVDGPNGKFKVSYIQAETLDEVFYVRFVVTERPVYVGNVRISPDKAKIDFGIRYYNPKNVRADWSTGPSNPNITGAQVGYASASISAALFASFSNGTQDNKPSSVTFGSGVVVGNFTWAPTAKVTVNGFAADGIVYAHVTDQSQRFNGDVVGAISLRFLFFSFEGYRPDYVYWDPVLGADINYAMLDAKRADANALGFSLVAIVACVLAALH